MGEHTHESTRCAHCNLGGDLAGRGRRGDGNPKRNRVTTTTTAGDRASSRCFCALDLDLAGVGQVLCLFAVDFARCLLVLQS
jgi:hypothetical protein